MMRAHGRRRNEKIAESKNLPGYDDDEATAMPASCLSRRPPPPRWRLQLGLAAPGGLPIPHEAAEVAVNMEQESLASRPTMKRHTDTRTSTHIIHRGSPNRSNHYTFHLLFHPYLETPQFHLDLQTSTTITEKVTCSSNFIFSDYLFVDNISQGVLCK